MNKADCFHLGHIAKLHGYKGGVSLFLDVTNPSDYTALDSVFIDIDNNLTPFFVESMRMTTKGFAVIHFEGVTDEDYAKKILRKKVYLPAEILPELTGINFYDHEVVGFKVIDAKHGNVGILQCVVDLSVNPLLQIAKDGKEILVPLIEGVVQQVDRQAKELHIKAPDGLIELYLG
jgi:16S rRNA processing protein RimM